jgi:hypothetical protein
MTGKGTILILVVSLVFSLGLNGFAEEYNGTMEFNEKQGLSYDYAWKHCVNDLPAGTTPDTAEIEISVKVFYWGTYPGVIELVCNDQIPINTGDPANLVGTFSHSTNPSSSSFYTSSFTLKSNHMAAFANDKCIWFAMARRYGGTFYLDYATVTLQTASALLLATPTFSPLPGTFDSGQQVEISCGTPGADIYYTTNGDDPTESSTPYDQSIAIDTTTTLKARAYKNGWTDSEIAVGIYTINKQDTIATPWIPLLMLE